MAKGPAADPKLIGYSLGGTITDESIGRGYIESPVAVAKSAPAGNTEIGAMARTRRGSLSLTTTDATAPETTLLELNGHYYLCGLACYVQWSVPDVGQPFTLVWRAYLDQKLSWQMSRRWTTHPNSVDIKYWNSLANGYFSPGEEDGNLVLCPRIPLRIRTFKFTFEIPEMMTLSKTYTMSASAALVSA